MRALEDRNARPLEAWDQERFPILRNALQAWAHDAVLGDRLACRIVRGAFSAVRAGRAIRSELSWMAAVARRGWAEIRARDRPIGDPLPDNVHTPSGEPIDELIRQEDCERARRVIASLPSKYRLALTLRYLLDRTEGEVAAYLQEHFRIGLDGTRRILKEGRNMVKTGFEGRDPRAAFSARYARDKKNLKKPASKRTPLPPFPEHKRGARHCPRSGR